MSVAEYRTGAWKERVIAKQVKRFSDQSKSSAKDAVVCVVYF